MNFARSSFLVSIGLSAAVAVAAGCGSSSNGGSPGGGDDGGLDATAGGSGSGGNSSSGSSSGGSTSSGSSSGIPSGSSSGSPSGSSDAAADSAIGDGGADSGPDASLEAGADAGPEAGIDSGPDASPEAGVDSGPDAAADSGTDAGCVSLTVKNYLTWCTLSVNGQTLVESHGPGTTSTSTVCVPPGTIDLVASPISTTFELGPDPWHDTSGDHGSGDPGTQADLDGGVHATSSTTLVATSGSACVWACCPFTDGTGCGVGNQCP